MTRDRQRLLRSLGVRRATSVSPTAHYTGRVWQKHGLSYPELDTTAGHILDWMLAPANRAMASMVDGQHLERMLRARHQAIDDALQDAIEREGVRQVLEIASGLSPRGLRFAERFADLNWVDMDLPKMASLKRRRVQDHARKLENYCVAAGDAFRAEGSGSVEELIARHFSTDEPLVVISEGLVNYFPRESVLALWSSLHAAMARHPRGVYLSDIFLNADVEQFAAGRAFRRLLEAFTRGEVHLHFETERELKEALAFAGFSNATIRDPFAGGRWDEPSRRTLVRVFRADVGSFDS